MQHHNGSEVAPLRHEAPFDSVTRQILICPFWLNRRRQTREPMRSVSWLGLAHQPVVHGGEQKLEPIRNEELAENATEIIIHSQFAVESISAMSLFR
jgi:hypothetical protein